MRAALRGGQDILHEDEIKRTVEKNSVCPTRSPTIHSVRLVLAVANSAQAANPISGGFWATLLQWAEREGAC